MTYNQNPKEPMVDALTQGKVIEAAGAAGQVFQLAFVPIMDDTSGVWVIRDTDDEISHTTDAESVQRMIEIARPDVRVLPKGESVFDV